MRRDCQSFTNRPAGLRISNVTSCVEVVIGGVNDPIAEQAYIAAFSNLEIDRQSDWTTLESSIVANSAREFLSVPRNGSHSISSPTANNNIVIRSGGSAAIEREIAIVRGLLAWVNSGVRRRILSAKLGLKKLCRDSSLIAYIQLGDTIMATLAG